MISKRQIKIKIKRSILEYFKCNDLYIIKNLTIRMYQNNTFFEIYYKNKCIIIIDGYYKDILKNINNFQIQENINYLIDNHAVLELDVVDMYDMCYYDDKNISISKNFITVFINFNNNQKLFIYGHSAYNLNHIGALELKKDIEYLLENNIFEKYGFNQYSFHNISFDILDKVNKNDKFTEETIKKLSEKLNKK